ncbi:MAG: hypothetical protein CM15mP59_0280 [Flavobacteriaceae bacterium]|nr:MAG: hypothetical protein CM15mP59_0280 [Flavobacteriaceae bacterium]
MTELSVTIRDASNPIPILTRKRPESYVLVLMKKVFDKLWHWVSFIT